jgi:heat shock protein HslJ
MKTIMAAALSGLSVLFMLSGCGKTSAPSQTSREILVQLAGKSWRLDRWFDTGGVNQDVGVITFAVGDECRISGNASVNRYMGQAKFSGNGALDLSSGFATTMMMGPPEAMKRETQYLAALRQIHRASLENDRLILTGDDSLRLEFMPEPK